MSERLQKLIANAGYGSRRWAERLIEQSPLLQVRGMLLFFTAAAYTARCRTYLKGQEKQYWSSYILDQIELSMVTGTQMFNWF